MAAGTAARPRVLPRDLVAARTARARLALAVAVARLADRDVAPKFASLYLAALDDAGRPAELTPSVAREGHEPAEFACHFCDWAANAHAAGGAFADPYASRLAERGRTEMFGRACDAAVRASGSAHVEGPCALGVSPAWLGEVAGTAAPPPARRAR